MILITTTGQGSMDRYAQQLAKHLSVEMVSSDIYHQIAERFNIPWRSAAALQALVADWRFVRLLNAFHEAIHLPNHHLGRYGNFLRTPYLITVHDLIRYFDLKGYPTLIHPPNLRDKCYLALDYRGIRKATKIIAVSEATRHDLMRHLQIAEERIAVVYEGVDHQLFRPVVHRLVDYPYLLFVGSEHPRKNFGGVLRAFRRLKTEGRFKDLKLLKVGKAGGAEAPFRQQTLHLIKALQLGGEVIFTEYVPDEDLPAYYAAAECFVFPSFYEGFGLPVLEAMACGCPVIISNRAALPEIAGGAAPLIDPLDIERLAGAVREVITNQAHRKDLIKKGLERAAGFSWQRMAEGTLQVYREVEALQLNAKHTQG
jgi:glycosyltransferase involved in cell wall biosynthesis